MPWPHQLESAASPLSRSHQRPQCLRLVVNLMPGDVLSLPPQGAPAVALARREPHVLWPHHPVSQAATMSGPHPLGPLHVLLWPRPAGSLYHRHCPEWRQTQAV